MFLKTDKFDDLFQKTFQKYFYEFMLGTTFSLLVQYSIVLYTRHDQKQKEEKRIHSFLDLRPNRFGLLPKDSLTSLGSETNGNSGI